MVEEINDMTLLGDTLASFLMVGSMEGCWTADTLWYYLDSLSDAG